MPDDNIIICHWNNGQKMWVPLTIDPEGLNGHEQHPRDIWPPYPGVTPGQNWPQGAGVFLNGCSNENPEPTPTASPSETPAPTPEPTSSGSPAPPPGPVPSPAPTPSAAATTASASVPPPGPTLPKTGQDSVIGLILLIGLTFALVGWLTKRWSR